MPSKKQRARAAKAAKAAAQAAEPPRQPALDGPRTLRAELRTQMRAARRCGGANDNCYRPGGASYSEAAAVAQRVPALFNHHREHTGRGKVIAARERLQTKRINRACVAAIAALDMNDTA